MIRLREAWRAYRRQARLLRAMKLLGKIQMLIDTERGLDQIRLQHAIVRLGRLIARLP